MAKATPWPMMDKNLVKTGVKLGGGTSGAKSFGLNSGGTTSPPNKSEPVVGLPVQPRSTRHANYVGSQGR